MQIWRQCQAHKAGTQFLQAEHADVITQAVQGVDMQHLHMISLLSKAQAPYLYAKSCRQPTL